MAQPRPEFVPPSSSPVMIAVRSTAPSTPSITYRVLSVLLQAAIATTQANIRETGGKTLSLMTVAV
jgi:hypothetical protein